jgi:hypothetical protein
MTLILESKWGKDVTNIRQVSEEKMSLILDK